MQQALSAIVVSVITALSAVLPNANLPKVLGDETVSTDVSVSASPTTKNSLLESARMKREEVSQRIQEKKQQVTDKIASREAELKDKISQIKDERKQKIVENLDQKIATLNSKWVTHWNNVLTRLTEILAKIENRGNNLAADGKDITSLTAAIAQAKIDIANAQGAVDAQSGKTYVIDITTEDNLGQDVKTTISQFHSDIKTALSLVETARQSVKGAFSQLTSLAGEKVQLEGGNEPG